MFGDYELFWAFCCRNIGENNKDEFFRFRSSIFGVASFCSLLHAVIIRHNLPVTSSIVHMKSANDDSPSHK